VLASERIFLNPSIFVPDMKNLVHGLLSERLGMTQFESTIKSTQVAQNALLTLSLDPTGGLWLWYLTCHFAQLLIFF